MVKSGPKFGAFPKDVAEPSRYPSGFVCLDLFLFSGNIFTIFCLPPTEAPGFTFVTGAFAETFLLTLETLLLTSGVAPPPASPINEGPDTDGVLF